MRVKERPGWAPDSRCKTLLQASRKPSFMGLDATRWHVWELPDLGPCFESYENLSWRASRTFQFQAAESLQVPNGDVMCSRRAPKLQLPRTRAQSSAVREQRTSGRAGTPRLGCQDYCGAARAAVSSRKPGYQPALIVWFLNLVENTG